MSLRAVDLYIFEDASSNELLGQFFTVRANSPYREVMNTRVVVDMARNGIPFPTCIKRFPCLVVTSDTGIRYTDDMSKIRSFIDDMKKPPE